MTPACLQHTGEFVLAPLDAAVWERRAEPEVAIERLPLPGEAYKLHGLLTPQQVQELRAACVFERFVPVAINGRVQDWRAGEPSGFLRGTAFSDSLAQQLFQALPRQLLGVRTFGPQNFSDWDGHPTWVADGVNPMLRFLSYPASTGQLVAHYDAPYIETPQRRSLWTLLIYLSDNPRHGGSTRFLHDKQVGLPFDERNHDDWVRPAHPDEVALRVEHKAGDALLFEHRMLHDVEPLCGTQGKLALRTDVMFSKAPL